uniref:DUF2795 domain-containing protein n=1 Tax=Heterorhabditis bacteriophora TaxID=37862 RepID=A0A1I7X3I1_HETBA
MSNCVNDCSKTNEDEDNIVCSNNQKTREECSINEDQTNSNAPDPEVLAAEKVLNAFLYYKRFGREKICQIVVGLKQLPTAHQLLLGPTHSEHIRNVLKGVDHNHE